MLHLIDITLLSEIDNGLDSHTLSISIVKIFPLFHPDEKKTESRAAETVNGDIARATFLAAVDSNISHFAHSLPSIRF